MPDRLRRLGFAAALATLTAAFAGAVGGIATTHGRLDPAGRAAGIAARQRSADQVPRPERVDCPWRDVRPARGDV